MVYMEDASEYVQIKTNEKGIEGGKMNEELCMNEICEKIVDLDDNARIILKEILFEADITDSNRMKELVYSFGSKIRGDDKFGRMIFMRLAAVFLLV